MHFTSLDETCRRRRRRSSRRKTPEARGREHQGNIPEGISRSYGKRRRIHSRWKKKETNLTTKAASGRSPTSAVVGTFHPFRITTTAKAYDQGVWVNVYSGLCFGHARKTNDVIEVSWPSNIKKIGWVKSQDDSHMIGDTGCYFWQLVHDFGSNNRVLEGSFKLYFKVILSNMY
ncbi:hypothetical protein JTE90_029560 [Oedothorax gibbosus]|uniref:Uncharacterized protein n=1 Tax=Oedothorax gibbosus TaxID=931172 RepID=A0AAV6VDT6_9ARAC|nr:hypothetical protein JTE90_029560 [Oedothorax gibbosus]